MTTPAIHALRYRIHGYAAPRGWDCTVTEIADALGEPMPRVRNACIKAGWTERLRGVRQPDGRDDVPSAVSTRFAANAIAAAYRAQMMGVEE